MRTWILAAFALTAATSLNAQAVGDLSYATPLNGSWAMAASPGGSEAVFRDSAGRVQLSLRCTRSTRRITLSKPASSAAAALTVWTSSLTRDLPASFNPATGLLSAEVAAFDGLLDAMTFSRGRFGVRVIPAAALVLPVWQEPARVVEDCRA